MPAYSGQAFLIFAMIVDLDISPFRKKIKPSPPQVKDIPVSYPREAEKPAHPKPDKEKDRKAYLLNEIQEKENYIRYQRALVHRKYKGLLDHRLLPKKGTETDFAELYDQIDSFTEDLKNLWIKRQQVEKYGDLREQKILSNQDLAKIAALKHRRNRVNDNLYKAKKALEIAKSTGHPDKEAKATQKIEQLELERLEIAHELNKLEDVK